MAVSSRPHTPGVALTKILKPTAEKLGLPKIGWHTFRHSYKAWIASGTATLTQQEDLMGQAQHRNRTHVWWHSRSSMSESRVIHQK